MVILTVTQITAVDDMPELIWALEYRLALGLIVGPEVDLYTGFTTTKWL